MAVLMKRSEVSLGQECPWGCCTRVYGKNIKKIRRSVKRRESQNWRKSDYNN